MVRMNIQPLSLFQHNRYSTNGTDIRSLPFVDWQKYAYLSFLLDYSTHYHSIKVLFHTVSEESKDILIVVMNGAAADASFIIITGNPGNTFIISGSSHGVPQIL